MMGVEVWTQDAVRAAKMEWKLVDGKVSTMAYIAVSRRIGRKVAYADVWSGMMMT